MCRREAGVLMPGITTYNALTGQTGLTLAFLENGRLNAYGLGGSLMLDYERYRPENEIDVELRYTHIYLQSFASSRSELAWRRSGA
jgi:hypothetical protein